MKIIEFGQQTVTVELDPADCLALADAIGWSIHHDIKGDWNLLEALRAALTAGALAAFVIEGGADKRQLNLAGLREVWAPLDGHALPLARVVEPPQ
jgi:hypothetical protein